MKPIHCSLLVAALAPACVASDLGDPSTSTTTAAVGLPGGGGKGYGDGTNCPSWGCGTNSPVIGPWNFHELDVDGEANAAGLKLVAMVLNGNAYRPEVVGAELIGHSLDEQSYPSRYGVDLAGATLRVEAPDGTYDIRIAAVEYVTRYWVGSPDLNYTYELEYTGPDQMDYQPVCHNPPVRSGAFPHALGALLFTGDRYDAARKLVISSEPDETRGWFNIACAGSALGKLHLNRHTTAGSTSDDKSTREQRQSMLKMFVSDVCGTGRPFTHAGEPLHYENADGWMTLDGTEASYEALWDADGALCLDEHRLEADPDYPDIRKQIDEECELVGHELRPCDELDGFPDAWQKLAYLLSANP
ncbi:MAG: hypothetical protein H6708_22005 [Kofleriaceae bacterium]|nr:hypothetical protein [Myxococcales bacterium]MCB9563090.1 hypothetical protein [Kofleriaceae bacterium]